MKGYMQVSGDKLTNYGRLYSTAALGKFNASFTCWEKIM